MGWDALNAENAAIERARIQILDPEKCAMRGQLNHGPVTDVRDRHLRPATIATNRPCSLTMQAQGFLVNWTPLIRPYWPTSKLLTDAAGAGAMVEKRELAVVEDH
jgi:hypothetical protein